MAPPLPLLFALVTTAWSAVPTMELDIEEKACTDRYIHFALFKCHKHLAHIGTAILQSPNHNYTEACQ
jgi:hypothetical protein